MILGQAVVMLLIVAVLVAVAVIGKKRDKARAARMESEGKLSDQQASVPEKKATSGCAWAGLIFVVLCFVVCVATPDRPSTPRRSYQRHASIAPVQADNSFEVEYRVTSNGGIGNITYSNESGGTSQLSSANSPWTHKFSAEPGSFCYVSAQNTSAGGTMRVEIRIDGVVVEQSESAGPHVIATASGYY
jgi:hypothetical protein